MKDFVDDQMPYRKKARQKKPKKSDHKHDFQPCVFEYPEEKYDKERGMVLVQGTTIGSYCTICGKIGDRGMPWMFEFFPFRPNGCLGVFEDTAKAEKELDPKTRTLPTFHLDDYFRSKYVSNFEERG